MTSSCSGLLISANRPKLGNRQRIIELYDALRPSLRAYLYCLGISSDRAEDIIQETCLRLVRHLPEESNADNLRGWVIRVAHNLSKDVYRSPRRWSCTSSDESPTVVWENRHVPLSGWPQSSVKSFRNSAVPRSTFIRSHR